MSLNLNTTNKISKTPSKPSIRIDLRELLKKELPETKGREKIIEDIEDNDHEKSNGNLIIENINFNNQINSVDMKIFEYLNKMKNPVNETSNNNHENDDNNNIKNEYDANFDNINKENYVIKEEKNSDNDSLDNLIIKNQKELIGNHINLINRKKNHYNSNLNINDFNKENNYDLNNVYSDNLNKSLSKRNIKMKIDDNDDIIVEEEY